MAIQPIHKGNTLNASTQAKPVNKSQPEATNQAVHQLADDDSVKITSFAQDIQKAADVGKSEPVVNLKRVAELKASIESGAYKIDPQSIADKILQFDRKLPNSS